MPVAKKAAGDNATCFCRFPVVLSEEKSYMFEAGETAAF